MRIHSVLQKSLAGAQGGSTQGRGKMGKDDGVELEADVGFKDGKKEVFSPHGLSDRQDSNRSSHVDEDAQVFSFGLPHMSCSQLRHAEGFEVHFCAARLGCLGL